MKRWPVLVLCVLAACAGGDGGSSADLAVLDAWTRPSPPGITEAAIYLSIANETAPDDHIAGMSSDRCATVIPHRTVIEDDVASMPGILGDELALPTGGDVVMEPNGLHLMCLGLGSPLETGDEFSLELTFDTHAPIETTVQVLDR